LDLDIKTYPCNLRCDTDRDDAASFCMGDAADDSRGPPWRAIWIRMERASRDSKPMQGATGAQPRGSELGLSAQGGMSDVPPLVWEEPSRG
jgi:hypothetical protein